MALATIANHQHKPVSLKQISVHEGISVSYLEQLFVHLRRAGLVQSVRGPGGGYLLARSLNDISVAEIMSVVQESVQPVNCADCTMQQPGCNLKKDSTECMTRPVWEKLEQVIGDFLSSVTLQDIIAGQV